MNLSEDTPRRGKEVFSFSGLFLFSYYVRGERDVFLPCVCVPAPSRYTLQTALVLRTFYFSLVSARAQAGELVPSPPSSATVRAKAFQNTWTIPKDRTLKRLQCHLCEARTVCCAQYGQEPSMSDKIVECTTHSWTRTRLELLV